MIESLLTRANLKVRTLFEQYCKIADEQTALIMACAEGGQPELVQPLLELKKQDQNILMEETYRHLMPREELYPPNVQSSPHFALDDFAEEEEDAQEKNNADE